MTSPRRWRALSSPLCAAALGVAAFGCSSSIDVEPSPSPPPGGSDAGLDAAPPDPPAPPPDTMPDGGPDSGPPEPACDCPSSPGVVLSGDLGPLTLTAPYTEANDQMYCTPSLAYAWGFHCSWNFDLVVLNACLDKDTAPCIRITWKQLDDESGSVTIEGKVIDGAGEVWTLSDIALDGTLPWNGPAATGTFTAVGTDEEGNKKISIGGSFDLCVAESSACPN